MTAFAARALASALLVTACYPAEGTELTLERAELAQSESPSIEVDDATRDAFARPIPGLSASERTSFFLGNSYFNQTWLSAPSSVESRDGLGPLFNARSCSSCHLKDGRGAPPEPGAPLRSMLLRISLPGLDHRGAPRPDPRYGDQLQGDAVTGVAREADVKLHYRELPGAFADGEPYSLREPSLMVESLGYGALTEGLLTSVRVAPVMIGLGLLEAVPDHALLDLADPEDRNRDGISGRVNRVHSVQTGRAEIGRFGWKAEQPSVREQTAAAFQGDMGLTTRLFPSENHTDTQLDSTNLAHGGDPEVTDQVFASVVAYARTLAVPARRQQARADVRRGEEVFGQAGCALCHLPVLVTDATAVPTVLAHRTIHPYTDLLLHDMGPALSDNRPSFDAEGAEWRTAPLWGIGLVERVNGHTFFLHDGRARSLAEAVLWHGGEAEPARARFVKMSKADRGALISFLESL